MASSLHSEAVEAEKHLEALATGLAEAGAPEQTTKAVTQMADVVRQLVQALGQGQSQTGDNEPAAAPEPEAPSHSDYGQAAGEVQSAVAR